MLLMFWYSLQLLECVILFLCFTSLFGEIKAKLTVNFEKTSFKSTPHIYYWPELQPHKRGFLLYTSSSENIKIKVNGEILENAIDSWHKPTRERFHEASLQPYIVDR